MPEKILIVDEKDRVVGKEEKEKCHQGRGILHRAFLIMLFNRGQLLLTKRSKEKKLWPGFWDGTVASHFREDRNLEKTVKKRVKEELGISVSSLKYLDKFKYQAKYGNTGGENEICYLYKGYFKGKIILNMKEVADYKFLKLEDFKKEVKKNPKIYTPWLKIAMRIAVRIVIKNAPIHTPPHNNYSTAVL